MATEQISVEPDLSVHSVDVESSPGRPDWRFAWRPFWLFSHLFALGMVSLFVILGLWQLDRLDQRRAQNQIVEARTAAQPLVVDAQLPDEDFDFLPAVVRGRVVDADAARIANRSQGGVAGEHVVAVLELSDGSLLAVNRGFVPVNADVELDDLPGDTVNGTGGDGAEGTVELTGWLRNSVEPEGWFAVADTGEGRLLPRLDTSALAQRLDGPVVSAWLQLGTAADDAGVVGDDAVEARFPDPVALPELGEGPHLSYAGQWFIFAALGVAFYLATVRRRAHRRPQDDPAAP